MNDSVTRSCARLMVGVGLLMAGWPMSSVASVPLRPGELGSNTPICCIYPSRQVNACLEWGDGTYTLEWRGHRPEKLTDEIGFAYTVVEGDFSFIVRLADAPELAEGCQYGNYGIAVRDDLVGTMVRSCCDTSAIAAVPIAGSCSIGNRRQRPERVNAPQSASSTSTAMVRL